MEFADDYTGNERTAQREMPKVCIILLINFWLKARLCIDGMIFYEA